VSQSNQVHIPIVFGTLVVSRVPKYSSHSPPLQVYSHNQTSHCPSDVSLLVPALPPPLAPTIEPDLSIVIQKGIHSTRNLSPHYTALSCHRLSQPFYTCLSSISSVSNPKTVGDTLAHPGWHQVMVDEMSVLQNNGTLELDPLSSGKSVVGCRWVFAIKVGLDDTIDSLKAHLVAKGYTQNFGLDYGDTFSLLAKITFVRLFIAMTAIQRWPLYQLDVKNDFLNGDLEEEIYMEQPLGFVAQRESSKLVCRLYKSLYGLKQSLGLGLENSSVLFNNFVWLTVRQIIPFFYRHSRVGSIYLVVYVDDIVLTSNDNHDISQKK